MKRYTIEVLPIIISAVNKLVDFVKPTYGPSNNKVILHNKILDDGFMIANEFELEDPFENRIVNVIREVSAKTNRKVGDGTTGSLILLQALINELSNANNFDVKGLGNGLEEAKKQLLEQVVKIETKEDIEKVAYNSFNNKKIAGLIADALIRVGKDGALVVEDSPSLETTLENTEGLEIDSGFLSSYMITEGQNAVWNNPYILVTDQKVSSIQQVLTLIESMVREGKKNLVIIADDVEGEALATFVVNKLKGMFNVLAIKAPGFGVRKRELLEDIAASVGATLISQQTGTSLEKAEVEQLGLAAKVIATEEKTTIIQGAGSVEDRITSIKAKIEKAESDFDKDFLEKRLAKLSGGIAVIKVGAATEAEVNALKFKVEDAVNASKLAYKSGVVQGAGVALSKLETSSSILNNSLKYPAQQLKENGGDIDENVYDPVDVLIAALENAVSIASLLITSKGLLVEVETNQ